MLAKYPFVQTRNFQSARQAMLGTGIKSFSVKNDAGVFSMSANFANFRSLSLLYVDCSSPGMMEMAPATFMRQYFPICGSGRLTTNGTSTDISPASPGFVVPSENPLVFEGGENYRHLAVRIETKALQRKLRALLGEEPTDALTFDSASSAPGSHVQSIRQAVFQFAHDLDVLGNGLPNIASEELEQTILIRYLLFYHHNYSGMLARPPASPSHVQIKAAKDYIEANWDKPLDVEAVAQAAGTSARSLFRHFKQTENRSPSDFAKSVRLARARMMLRSTGKDTSVLRVAQICGFRSFGHFARDYRVAYGERPSDTLRQVGR